MAIIGVMTVEEKIKFSLWLSLPGGPHNNPLALAFKQVITNGDKVYMQQVKTNAKALAPALLKRKCRLVAYGTVNHLLLSDLTTFGFVDRNCEEVCEACYITLNKCATYGSIPPGGVGIGAPAMTPRGCLQEDFEALADFLLR